MFGCSVLAKDVVHRSIVRPCMEHACVVWSPRTAKDCSLLDAVQNQAARWIMGSHWDPMALKWSKSSSNCISDLRWPSLTTRRVFLSCLLLFTFFMGKLYPDSRNISCPCDLTILVVTGWLFRLFLPRSIPIVIHFGIFLWNKLSFQVLDESLPGNSFHNLNRHFMIGYFCNLWFCIVMCLYVVNHCYNMYVYYSCVCVRMLRT